VDNLRRPNLAVFPIHVKGFVSGERNFNKHSLRRTDFENLKLCSNCFLFKDGLLSENLAQVRCLRGNMPGMHDLDFSPGLVPVPVELAGLLHFLLRGEFSFHSGKTMTGNPEAAMNAPGPFAPTARTMTTGARQLLPMLISSSKSELPSAVNPNVSVVPTTAPPLPPHTKLAAI
jgi:hypothetical protein